MPAKPTPYSSVLSINGYCNICYSPYDSTDFKPLLICSNDHTTCKHCLLAIKVNLRCPFCRADIHLHKIRLNSTALDQAAVKSRGCSILDQNSRRRMKVTLRNMEKRVTEYE